MTRASALLLALTLLGFILSLSSGKVWLSPFMAHPPAAMTWIFLNLRLPRAVLGLMLGGTLGLSGAVLQGFLRNPLADPSLVGISSSAALGAVVALALGGSAVPGLVFAAAMIGAAAATALLLALTRLSPDPLSFILGGMVLSSLTGALVALVISLAPSPFAVTEIVTWLMGALTDRGWDEVVQALPCIALGLALLIGIAPALDALSLGEMTATSLGVNLRRTQMQIALGLGLAVGACVAITGVVGFVGLIVPHIIRRWVGARPSGLLLPSALGGALLVLLADALVRLTPGAGEVRLGVVMALLGAPFFVLIMRRKDRLC